VNIAISVQQKIKDQFFLEERLIVLDKIEEIYSTKWNLGQDLLCDSILLLSDGSIEKFLSFFPISDPRDIVFVAQSKK
jgi:hypothetical protein